MYKATLLETGDWAIRDNNGVNRLVRNQEAFTPAELTEKDMMAFGVARFDTAAQCQEVIDKLNK